MSDNFDPYYKWLGIPPEEQPPNHYRLLGLRPFESDPDVIANAVDQRMTHLRTFQGGKNAVHSQKILNEISSAKLCLFSAPKKAEYDRILRARLAPTVAMPPGSVPGPPTSPLPLAPPGHPAAAVGLPFSGVYPQARQPQPQMMPQPMGMGSPGQGTYAPAPFRPAGPSPAPTNSAALSSPAGIEDFVPDSGRRPSSRSRRKTNAWLGPAVVGMILLAALVGVLVAFKNSGHDESQSRLEPVSDGKKAKTGDSAGPPRQEAPVRRSEKVAKDQEPASSDKPADGKTAEGGSASHSPSAAALKTLLKRLSASVAGGHIQATETVGGPGGAVFRDLPSSGGLLVGFDFGLGAIENSDTPEIISVCGAFLVSDKVTRRLKTHGGEQQSVEHVRAKPGYAVGGLELAPGDHVTGLRVLFCAIDKDGLSNDATYYSSWIGSSGDQSTVKLGDGRPVVGIAGTASSLVNRLGLIVETAEGDNPDSPETPLAKKPPTAMPLAEDSGPAPTANTAPAPDKVAAAGGNPPMSAMPAAADWSRRVFDSLPGGNDQPRVPVPAAEDLRTARTTVRDLFKDQYAEINTASSKTSLAMEKKYALGKTLFQAADKESDPAVRYVLLDEARKLTSQIGDSQAVLMTINALTSYFQIDEVPLTIDTLTEAGNVPSATPAAKRQLAENAVQLIGKAVARERFDAADKLADLARKVATGIQDTLLRQQVAWRRARLVDQRKAYDDAQSALETLKKDPSDAGANLIAGRYRCLFQEDWKAGLPLLAKASDPTLKRLAEQELNPPGEPVAQVKLGDEWSSAARPDEPLSPYYQMRSRQWYELALPRLAGVSKLSAQAKLEKMLGGHGLKADFFAGAGNFDDKIKSRVDAQIDFQWGKTLPDDVPSNQFSVRWIGWLATPGKAGQYTIVLEHDAGARLWIDAKPVFDGWSGPGRQEVAYLLQPNKPRLLKIEYFSSGKGDPRISLRWSQRDGFPEQPIPAEALFQERSGAEKGFSQLPVPRPGTPGIMTLTSPDAVPAVPLP